jgi:antitoxin component YwqK of YwqJK toxin-antitoxin module
MTHFFKALAIPLITLFLITSACAEDFIPKIPDIEGTETVRKGQHIILSSDRSFKAVGYTKSGKRHGKWTIFKMSLGKEILFAEGTYYLGTPSGLWKFFDENRSKKAQIVYSRNKVNITIFQKKSPIPKRTYTLLNGLKNGQFHEYYRDGKPHEISFYINGKKHKQINIYYPNGKFKEIGYYSMGVKTGKWQFYRNNGQLMKSGYYENNKKTGTWITYDEHGRPESEKQYN